MTSGVVCRQLPPAGQPANMAWVHPRDCPRKSPFSFIPQHHHRRLAFNPGHHWPRPAPNCACHGHDRRDNNLPMHDHGCRTRITTQTTQHTLSMAAAPPRAPRLGLEACTSPATSKFQPRQCLQHNSQHTHPPCRLSPECPIQPAHGSSQHTQQLQGRGLFLTACRSHSWANASHVNPPNSNRAPHGGCSVIISLHCLSNGDHTVDCHCRGSLQENPPRFGQAPAIDESRLPI